VCYPRVGAQASPRVLSQGGREWSKSDGGGEGLPAVCISSNNKHPEIQRDGNVNEQSRNCCCCPCATRIMRWRGLLPAQSNYQLGILAAKHALISPANPRVATACQRLPLCQDSSPNAAEWVRAYGEWLGTVVVVEMRECLVAVYSTCTQ
jgi:hypothetical protein